MIIPLKAPKEFPFLMATYVQDDKNFDAYLLARDFILKARKGETYFQFAANYSGKKILFFESNRSGAFVYSYAFNMIEDSATMIDANESVNTLYRCVEFERINDIDMFACFVKANDHLDFSAFARNYSHNLSSYLRQTINS